ncbi:MAG TPA: energy transducer TonB [Gammaproteobacteria bacterium]|nr:energy transducer TonB [Gammaproteobacteria bacterium]
MTHTYQKPTISHNDRIGLTLFLAITLHALVILGISFNSDDIGKQDLLATMDITLVQHKTDQAPDKADYLAQANLKGSGNTREKVRHHALQSKPSPEQTKGHADQSIAPSMTSPNPKGHVQLLTREQADSRVHSSKKELDVKRTRKISTRELIRRSKEIARLSAQNDAYWQAYSKRPDSKYIYANTKKHADAAYLTSWSRKVERIGNMNYPSEAQRKNMNGNLIMEVTLKPDGNLISVRILKSSTHKILDRAAINIVKLAAPFSHVPESVLENRKVLRIVRTWSFTDSNRLYSR